MKYGRGERRRKRGGMKTGKELQSSEEEERKCTRTFQFPPFPSPSLFSHGWSDCGDGGVEKPTDGSDGPCMC